MQRPWYIAVSHPSCERIAAARLTERGFETWYPTQEKPIENRYTAKLKTKPTRSWPLFPGYMFARPGRGGLTHHEMIGADGFRAILMNDFRPLTVSDDELARLRDRLANPEPEDEQMFRVGQLVYVAAGPFAMQSGSIGRVRTGKLGVLLNLLGRETMVEMLEEQVRAA